MNEKRRFLFPAALTLLLAVNASASPVATAEKNELVAARDEVAAKGAMTKGAAQQSFDLDRRRLDRLIDDLDAGRPVSPADIERAIDESRTNP